MKISVENIKKLIKAIGFKPEDGMNNIFVKKYIQHNYVIRVNFNTSKIEYRENDVKTENGIQWGDLTTSNFENSENFVVLECVNRLLEKGYAPRNLYLEYKFPLGRKEKGKLDILIFDNDGKAYLMIECKTWGTEFSKEEKKMLKDGGQLFSYYVQDKATKYLCLYTSRCDKGTVEYKNNIIKVDEVWSELTNQKEIHDHWNKNTKDNGIFEEWANAYDVEIKALVRSRLLPLTKDDSGRIFNQFAEILRHNVVSDKPNAFNKILNLFICKIIDEDKNDNEQVEFQWLEDDTDESLQTRLNDLYKQGMHRFLDIDVTDFSENDISNTLGNVGDSSAQKTIMDMFIKLRLQKNPEFAFIEVYDDNLKAGQAIFNCLAPITPGSDYSIRANTGLAELNSTKAIAVYVECEFHDTEEGANFIINNTDKLGKAIAHGICEYYGVSWVDENPESDTFYRVQVGAFSKKENADKQLEKLKEEGYDAFIVEVKK